MSASNRQRLGGDIYVGHGISCAPGAKVWARVRPEKIDHAASAPGAGADNVARGTVQDIAYMGDLSVYLVQLDSGKRCKVTMPNLVRSAEQRLTWEDRVYLTWHATAAVVLQS